MVVPVLYCQLLNTQEHSKLFANTLKSSSECSGQMENRGVGNFVLSYIISWISIAYGDSYLTVLEYNHSMHV